MSNIIDIVAQVCGTAKPSHDSKKNETKMSYLERTYYGVLAVTVACFGWYFIDVFASTDLATADIREFTSRIWIMFGIYVVLVIVMAIATHVFDADAEDEFDERDSQIDMYAERICSYFQATALFGILILVMYQFNAFVVAHVMLAAIVFTTILGLAVRLYLYRRGV